MSYTITLSNKNLDQFSTTYGTLDELQRAYKAALKLTNGVNANEWQIDVTVEITKRSTICDSICSPETLIADIQKMTNRSKNWAW